jgi:hypothetical protein
LLIFVPSRQDLYPLLVRPDSGSVAEPCGNYLYSFGSSSVPAPVPVPAPAPVPVPALYPDHKKQFKIFNVKNPAF